MLTKQLRELERQAGVVTIRKGLPIGNWMRKSEVLEYLKTQLSHTSLHHIVDVVLSAEISENDIEFIKTSDLQSMMMGVEFREMECVVPTLMIVK
jgi:hypothetical protein